MNETITGSKTRKILYEYIRDNPGTTFQVLKNIFRLSEGGLRYHLQYLERRNKILTKKNGKESGYFPCCGRRLRLAFDAKLSPDQERILEIIMDHPGIPLKELKERSGMVSQSFIYTMRKLKQSKIIWKTKTDKGIGYEVVTRERLVDEMFLSLMKKFTNGEISRDEMMDLIAKLEEIRDMGNDRE